MLLLHLLVLPLMAAAWAASAGLFVVLLRLMLAKFSGRGAARWRKALQVLTDPAHAGIQRWLTARFKRSLPAGVGWAVLVAALLMIQELLLQLTNQLR